jgi:sensor histidine kinase YesM
MIKFFRQLGQKGIFFTRPLILLVYIPLFFIVMMSQNALEGGGLSPGSLFNAAWNYELLALITFLVALLWEKIRSKFAFQTEADTLEFVLKYIVSTATGVVFGIELIKFIGADLVVKTLLLEIPRHIQTQFPPILIPSGFILLIIAGFRSSQRQHDKREEIERLYQKTRFQALKVQLNPHFLFNALNMISAEIQENPGLATEILDEFADLLRGVLKLSGLDEVSLEEECDLINHFLKIQEQRFSGRITTGLDLSDNCKAFRVPPLLLQPLVENSFVHGFEKSGQEGHVQVSAYKDEEYLYLKIEDNGQGFDPLAAKERIGVTYVREVLELFYQDNGRLQIRSEPGKGTECLIMIPGGNL